jgi:hypothetical protein
VVIMQRHYGGVRGTIMFRGTCPLCLRTLAGGNRGRGEQRGKIISLRRHKVDPRHPGSPWCSFRGDVPVDQRAMTWWSERRQRIEKQRSDRILDQWAASEGGVH